MITHGLSHLRSTVLTDWYAGVEEPYSPNLINNGSFNALEAVAMRKR